MWIKNSYDAWIDLSTYCNAACPQCHRTNPNGLNKVDWLELNQWDLNTFKKIYNYWEIPMVGSFEMCGTWGDPCMNKDIYKICEYIIENSKAKIVIVTNGSMRNDEWWWNLGSLCKKRLNVVFAVDGINQEMHEKYRRKTELKKVLDNMKSVTMAGARAEAFTVVFKHNQKHLNEIGKLAKSYGAKSHKWRNSDRFELGNKFYFYDENNNKEHLEIADND